MALRRRRQERLSVTAPLVAIVDDDTALCSSLSDLMHAFGYRTEAFVSAETLLLSGNLPTFDCIVADVNMSGMSGFKLVQKLLQEGITTPVILITALPGKHLEEDAVSMGAFCLLRKPFETSSLLECVKRGLRQ
jgi:FixJ family two-component response regulator